MDVAPLSTMATASKEEAAPERMVFTVSELNQVVRRLLEYQFAQVWVQGEVSNLSRPSSGHLYFSLKDEQAQVRCACFRPKADYLGAALENGILISVKAKVSLYPDRGDYQLIVEGAEIGGEGALQQAFRRLFLALKQEGLFRAERKRTLPSFPKRIGIITSRTGAALKDILKVLRQRAPFIEVRVYPAMVQGDAAAEQLIGALERAEQDGFAEVLLLGRGGGSAEDLWCFNDPELARAMARCTIPIVTGIGHEIDVTIADWVADYRAPTPSAAAAHLAPDKVVLGTTLAQLRQQLLSATRYALQRKWQRWDQARMRLRHPKQEILARQKWLWHEKARLHRVFQAYFEKVKLSYVHKIRLLSQISPLATLERGYTLVRMKTSDSHYITSCREAAVLENHTPLEIQFHDGVLLVLKSSS